MAACVAAALALSVAWLLAAAAGAVGERDRPGHYTPTWAVHVPGGAAEADALARDHGFVNLGEIFDSHYHFRHARLARRSAAPARAHHARLEGDARVRWARQQRLLRRAKRDFIYIATPVLPTQQTAATGSEEEGAAEARRRRDAAQRARSRARATDAKFALNDPKWPHMWYLNRGGGLDMNVIPAWREGITGRGVVVTILDDGLETDHPDLVANFDAQASYDVNSYDSDPQPRYDMIDSNRHGTRCAGEVAATANNSLCAVGVAFGARVGGVRMLDGDVTDAVEARSLSLNPQHVDIYSASWGPDDDGKTVDGPGELATRAFIEGVTKGRNGKGSIFVWASGNGGRDQDNCNCDGYTNSIWTLSISSATERGDVPWYSEMCSSTLATTYSSGALNEKQVVTTDLHHSCTSGHTGTSASAPLAAGICALALQANRDLTWRDMQHIVVRTARPERLSAGGDWRVNGVGRNVSHSFGYGLLDAAGMVRLARSWKTVPAQRRCELAAARPERAVPARGRVLLQLDVQACPGVNYLEHVQARVTLGSARRGDLQIYLTSPAGTRVTLLAPRAHDTSRAGFNSWPFMSVHMWGESPLGVWQLEVHNEGRYMGRATLQDWSLIFYGTTPPAAKSDPIPFRKPTLRSNATRPITVVTSGRKLARPKGIPPPNYTVGLAAKPKKAKTSKTAHRNSKMKGKTPAMRANSSASVGRAVEKVPARISLPTTPDLSLNLRGDLKDPLAASTGAPSWHARSEHGSLQEFPADPRGRKMSSLFEKYPKIQRIYPAPLQGTGDKLTEWELIFYGTETPPQEGAGGSAGGGEKNTLDDGGGVGGGGGGVERGATRERPVDHTIGVWQDTHKIRSDSGAETADRRAQGITSGCLAHSTESPHYCIECSDAMHLFKGSCYDTCPAQTFPSTVPPLPTTTSNASQELSSSLLKREAGEETSRSSEAVDMMLSENTTQSFEPRTSKICEPCHYSCLTCDGPHNHNCLTCPSDAELVNVTSAEDSSKLFFCYPSTVMPKISNANWYYKINFVLTLVLFVLLSIALYLFLSCAVKCGFCDFCCCGGDVGGATYNKVALDEKQVEAMEIKEEIDRAVLSLSESESEDDLDL